MKKKEREKSRGATGSFGKGGAMVPKNGGGGGEAPRNSFKIALLNVVFSGHQNQKVKY